MFENNQCCIWTYVRASTAQGYLRRKHAFKRWNLAQWIYQAAHEGEFRKGVPNETKLIKEENDSIYLSPLKVGGHQCCKHCWIFVHAFVCDFSITPELQSVAAKSSTWELYCEDCLGCPALCPHSKQSFQLRRVLALAIIIVTKAMQLPWFINPSTESRDHSRTSSCWNDRSRAFHNEYKLGSATAFLETLQRMAFGLLQLPPRWK